MASKSHSQTNPELPVLHLEEDLLVWVGRNAAGQLVSAECPLLDLYPVDVASKALDLARELGLRPRRLLLSLGATLLGEHVLRLPPVEPAELAGVFARRAQGWLECDLAEALYVAVPHLQLGEDAAKVGQDWSVFAARRKVVLDLLVEFRRLGMGITQCASQRAAVWRLGCSPDSTEGAALVVSREHRGTTIGLVDKSKIVLSIMIASQLEAGDEAALVAVVQEIRNIAGWWRKESRGQRLERVHLVGVEAELVDKLVPALRAAVGASAVVAEPLEQGGNWRVPGLLAHFAPTGPRAELEFKLAPRRTNLLRLGAVVAILLLGLGLVLHSAWESRRQALRAEYIDLQELEQRVARFELDSAAVSRALGELEAEASSVNRIAERRWPVGEVIEICQNAMPERTRLVSLALRQEEGGMRLVATGEAPTDPLATRQALSTLQQTLERCGLFENIELEPPSQVGMRVGQGGLPFELRADLIAPAGQELIR